MSLNTNYFDIFKTLTVRKPTVCMYTYYDQSTIIVIFLFYSPPKKRYTPVVTIDDPFPICIYELELAVSMLMHDVVFPSIIILAGELTPERLYVAIPL